MGMAAATGTWPGGAIRWTLKEAGASTIVIGSTRPLTTAIARPFSPLAQTSHSPTKLCGLLNRRKYQIGQGFRRIGLADATGRFRAFLKLIWGCQKVFE